MPEFFATTASLGVRRCTGVYRGDGNTWTRGMEVHLTPEEEAELSQIAVRKGRDAGQSAQEVLGYYLKHEARFIEAVKRGMASAERGEFVEHDEVLARIERLFER